MKAAVLPLALAVFGALYGADSLAEEQASNTSDIERITVSGRAQSLYRVNDGSLAMKTNTPIERTPQAVQILPLSLIEDQAATEVTELYRSISGVSQYNYASVTFRGFRQNDVRYDGVRGDPYGDVSTPQLFNIEQVQVLKGPSGALYGAGDPGGLINYVTKKPSYQRNNKVKLATGSDDFVSGSIELSGPLLDYDNQRYRVGIYQDHENPYRVNTDKRNRTIDLGYAFDLGEDTSITLQYTNVMQHNGGERLRGLPADMDGNFLTDRDFNFNEKSDFLDLDADVFQLSLEHNFNSWLSASMNVRYFEDTERQKYHEPRSATDTDDDGVADFADREYRDQDRHTQTTSVALNLVAELGDHTVLLGGDVSRQQEDFFYMRARKADGVVGISYQDPQYGVTDPDSYNMRLAGDNNTEALRYGVYLQDQWRITEAWDVTGSVSLDGFNDEAQDHMADSEEKFNDQGFSYRLGSTYKINEHFHPYLSWATGFTPQTVSSQLATNGGPFDPEESKQAEIGLRTFWFDDAVNINFAGYHIVRENILQVDPNDTDKQQALGKVRARGFEVDLMGDVTDNLVINANYAYNDTVVKDAVDGISRAVGDRFANAPRHQFGLWSRYDLSAINSSIAFGADYVSEQFDQDGGKIKPYTVFDLSWQTQWQAWQFQLNVKNLFDKEYAVSGLLNRTGLYPGEHRRVYASVSYAF